MPADHDRPNTAQPACLGCPVSDCRAEAGPDGGLLAGWRLAVVSVGLFLGPILLAIVGAACFSSGPESQLLGAMAGLVAGTGGSVAAARLIRRVNVENL